MVLYDNARVLWEKRVLGQRYGAYVSILLYVCGVCLCLGRAAGLCYGA